MGKSQKYYAEQNQADIKKYRLHDSIYTNSSKPSKTNFLKVDQWLHGARIGSGLTAKGYRKILRSNVNVL